MKTKQQKANDARKTAEARKAAKKADRIGKSKVQSTLGTGAGNTKKGRSVIPQSKAKGKGK